MVVPPRPLWTPLIAEHDTAGGGLGHSQRDTTNSIVVLCIAPEAPSRGVV